VDLFKIRSILLLNYTYIDGHNHADQHFDDFSQRHV